MHHKPLLMDDMRPMGSDEPSGKAPKRSRADAVSHLLKEHGPSLTGFVRRRLKSPQAVKDVIQEVWARILAAGDAPILNEVGHLFGTANNVVLEHQRRQKRDRRYRNGEPLAALDEEGETQDEVAQIRDENGDVTEIVEWRRHGEVLEQALAAMNPLRRALVILRFRDDLSVAETAAACGISAYKAERELRKARTFAVNFLKSRDMEIL